MGSRLGKLQVYLTDEQMAAIVCAPPELTTVALAVAIDAPYFTVAHARRRVQRQGWVCPLVWTVCVVCGQPLARQRARAGQRSAHPQCEPERKRQLARAYRALRPGLSTPYVREWRQRDPAHLERHRADNRARARRLFADGTPEYRQALLDKVRASDEDAYALTRDAASNGRALWSDDEDWYVWEHLETPARDVALVLGRTLWAVRTRRKLLRRRYAADVPA